MLLLSSTKVRIRHIQNKYIMKVYKILLSSNILKGNYTDIKKFRLNTNHKHELSTSITLC